TTYPGAAPEDVEDQVSQTIESAASTLEGLKNIQSTSLENISLVMLEMEYGTDMQQAHTDLSNNLEMYSRQLPDDVDSPTIIEINTNMMQTMTFSATAVGDVDLKYYVEEEIVPEFEKLTGVASVEVFGGQEDYISVQLIEEKMKQYHLNMSTVISMVQNADFSMPAGSVERGELDLTLRGGVSYKTADDLKDLPLTLGSGEIIHLSDIANVFQTQRDRETLSRYNGHETVTISVTKRQSASTISVTDALKEEAQRLNADNMGVQLEIVYDASEDIWSSITAVLQTMLYSVLFAMIVLFIFFGDWRASLIVGSSIPISIFMTMIVMSFLGFSFNVLSLGGLVIGVGMMVDNSIVVVESCFRLKTRNADYRQAAIEGTRFVTSSIVASTATTVVVFLPMALLEGMSGQLFGQLCFTIVFSLLASLLSALTVAPLVFYWLQPIEREVGRVQKTMDWLATVYSRFLPHTFRHKGIVVLCAVGMLVGSVMLVPLIGMELMPESDAGIITIDISTRPGLRLEELEKKIIPLEEMVKAEPDLDRYSLSSGSSMAAMSGGASASASITAYLRDEGRLRETQEIIDDWRARTAEILDCDITISSSSQMASMGSSSDIEINLQSIARDDLDSTALMVEDYLRKNPYITHVSSAVSTGNPQAEVVIDPVKASANGLVPAQVMSTLYTIMSGSDAATFTSGGREYDVTVEYPPERFQTVNDLSSLTITNSSGIEIPLLDIASIEYSNSPQSIVRKNGRYITTVSAQAASNAPRTFSTDINNQIAQLTFPAGVELTQSAMMESQVEELGNLLMAALTGVLLVFMVMAIQFESAIFSLIVMFCVPFALIGSFVCLFLSGCKISMTSMMGFLMLSGIVVNNGILFIDTANTMRREQDLSAEDALLTAGMLRMRPIFMTTLTTILGMVPLVVVQGGSSEMMKGMAWVIIGGLVTSTLLTLLLLPTFFLLVNRHDPEERAARRAQRLALRRQKRQQAAEKKNRS
ncbi:MAG: AcrB/AcrD/AcrF family protein, partial [Oscillospiraceae bacterium]